MIIGDSSNIHPNLAVCVGDTFAPFPLFLHLFSPKLIHCLLATIHESPSATEAALEATSRPLLHLTFVLS